MVKDRSGNVINYESMQIYHTDLNDFLSADIKNPCESQKEFRTLLIAACLDTQAKCRVEWERRKELDRQLKECQLITVRERAALMGA
jgi:hypothetical protein